MTKQPGDLGGRNDVALAGELPELGPFQPVAHGYLEADKNEIPDSEPGEFPDRGNFMHVELLDPPSDWPDHVFAQVTEGLDGWLVEKMGELEAEMEDLVFEIDVAEKSGSEETAPWRFGGIIVHVDDYEPA